MPNGSRPLRNNRFLANIPKMIPLLIGEDCFQFLVAQCLENGSKSRHPKNPSQRHHQRSQLGVDAARRTFVSQSTQRKAPFGPQFQPSHFRRIRFASQSEIAFGVREKGPCHWCRRSKCLRGGEESKVMSGIASKQCPASPNLRSGES